MRYEEEAIRLCLQVLESIRVMGTDNMTKILFIKQTLERPVKEETDGSNSK